MFDMQPSRTGDFMTDFMSGFMAAAQSPIIQQGIVEILKQLDPIQAPGAKKIDNISTAQNALEAYQNGTLTKAQAMQIVLICLQEDAAQKGQVIDITAKRNELARLFN